MRGLQVYFCPKCGFYGYYQLAKNAVCPNCNVTMRLLPIDYTKFMDLDYEIRDEYIGEEIIKYAKPLFKRLSETHQKYNNRQQIGLLLERIEELEKENKKLSETVEWMHETIWQMLRERKGLTTSSNSSNETTMTTSHSTESTESTKY